MDRILKSLEIQYDDILTIFGRDSFLIDGDSLCTAVMHSPLIDRSTIHGGQVRTVFRPTNAVIVRDTIGCTTGHSGGVSS